MLLGCQTIYGTDRGAELSAFLEQTMGQPCPCKQAKPCPLLPDPEPVAQRPDVTPGALIAIAASGAGVVALPFVRAMVAALSSGSVV